MYWVRRIQYLIGVHTKSLNTFCDRDMGASSEWGYAYWSSQADYGVGDMLHYCEHCAAGMLQVETHVAGDFSHVAKTSSTRKVSIL